MRRFLHLAAILLFAGCGGRVDDDSSSASDDGSCRYGTIATLDGAGWSVASAGDRVYVVATIVGPSGAGSAQGTLWEIAPDGTTTALSNGDTTSVMASFGDALAYGTYGNAKTLELDALTAPSSSMTVLDRQENGIYGPFGSNGSVSWLRGVADPSKAIPTLVHVTSPSDTPIVETFDPGITDVGFAVVTDGTNMFMNFQTKTDGVVIGQPPTSARSKKILVGPDPMLGNVIGVDDSYLVYGRYAGGNVPEQVMAVPKNGGSPVSVGTAAPPDTKILHDGYVYSLDHESTATSITTSIVRAREDGTDAQPGTVVTVSFAIQDFTFDKCGLVTVGIDPNGDTQSFVSRFKM